MKCMVIDEFGLLCCLYVSFSLFLISLGFSLVDRSFLPSVPIKIKKGQISMHYPPGMGILIGNRAELSRVRLKVKTSWRAGENM